MFRSRLSSVVAALALALLAGGCFPSARLVVRGVHAGEIATDARRVLFVKERRDPGGGVFGRELWAVPKTGGKPVSLFKPPADRVILRLAVAKDAIVLLTMPDPTKPFDKANQGQSIIRVPPKGGRATTLVSLMNSGAPNSVTVDDDYVYYVEGSSVSRVPLSGGAPEELAKTETRTSALALDPKYLYGLSEAGPFRLPKTGGALKLLHAPPKGSRFHGGCLAVAGGRLYYAASHQGTSIPVAGGDSTPYVGMECPLATHGPFLFARSGLDVTDNSGLDGSLGLKGNIMPISPTERAMWLYADGSGLFASSSAGNIYFQPIQYSVK